MRTGKHARPVRRTLGNAASLTAIVLAAVLGLTLAGPAAAATSTVYLSSPDWTIFTRDTGSLSIDATYGAPVGFGSAALVLRTPLANDKANMLRTGTASDADAALANVSYSTFRSSASTGQPFQVPALNVELDVDGDLNNGTGWTTLVFEPIYQAGGAAGVLSDQWQTWDADGAAKWWSTRAIPGVCAFDCFVSLTDILAANPDAVVLRYGINQGGGNAGIVAAADGLTIDGQTFDFAQAVTLESKDECKDGGWATSTDPVFVNQGDCVSYYVSNGKTHDS